MSEEFTCEECGDSFDTERGLSSHQAQVHSSGGEKVSAGNSGQISIAIGVRQALMAVFVIGIGAGFVAGMAAPLSITSGSVSPVQADAQQNPEPSDTGNQAPSGNNPSPTQDSGSIDMSKIEMKGEPVLGNPDAPVTMVVYEDFQCPFCKQFEENAFPKIKANYVDTGKVKVVWKDRPLPQLHPWAKPAAAAMECVYRVGGNDAFWSVKNKVFANQNSISTSNVESKIKKWASEEGVSKSAVQSCLDNQNPMEEVNEDSTEGQKLGASGTPTVFVAGKKIVGAQPYSNFKSAIESALG